MGRRGCSGMQLLAGDGREKTGLDHDDSETGYASSAIYIYVTLMIPII